MEVQGKTGVQTVSDGTLTTARLGKGGELSVQDVHARYYEAAYRNSVYSLSSGTVTMTSAFASGSAAGTIKMLCGIFNPTGSGKNAVILNSIVSLLLSKKAAGPFLYNYQNTPAVTSAATGTIINMNLSTGSTSSVMRAQNNVAIVRQDAATTAFTACGVIGGGGKKEVEVTTPGTVDVRDAPEGKIIVPPGTVFGITCTAAGEEAEITASLFWEEAPV